MEKEAVLFPFGISWNISTSILIKKEEETIKSVITVWMGKTIALTVISELNYSQTCPCNTHTQEGRVEEVQ